MKTYTEKEVESIIKRAFKAGENWGVTYYTWFTPSKEDQKEQLGKVMKRCKRGGKKSDSVISSIIDSRPPLLQEARDTLLLCTLIDKSGQAKEVVEKLDAEYPYLNGD